MPDISWNLALWDQNYDWTLEGEEWSSWWGGSEAQWFGSIYPRIHRHLPATKVLEIAPGHGRWTRYLLQYCESYVGIDLSGQAIDACKRRFARAPQASFFQNDGISLGDAPDGAFDFIFTFDSLVHAEMDVLRQYMPQLLSKLSDRGVAFIHHSNFNEMPPETDNPHSRASSVSADTFKELVEACGGQVLAQETLNWGGPNLIDCFTTFGKAGAHGDWEPVRIINDRWVDEMTIIRETQSPYSTLPSHHGGLAHAPREPGTLYKGARALKGLIRKYAG
ncbi:class I SAM-dependent methyltransferase [Thiocystis violacea]|uniref:class I SAM-dependent methyltransferase n=1 Tax=Thiocystis violacea TaxID=13725 RepID=UPI0019044DF3|nr:class I SAM-dependent methyltransferase [Thiocystis violacea]MBK1724122.1 hypothetical protein [Thiocystis violacea]